ncbi:hypothetical protein KC356_g118 [Hortaea werneckii]|nr:hypothetical protein KC356_g118 [Hortaea werneckii]
MRRGQAGVGLRASPNLTLWMSTLQHSAIGQFSKPRATATKTRFTFCDRHNPVKPFQTSQSFRTLLRTSCPFTFPPALLHNHIDPPLQRLNALLRRSALFLLFPINANNGRCYTDAGREDRVDSSIAMRISFISFIYLSKKGRYRMMGHLLGDEYAKAALVDFGKAVRRGGSTFTFKRSRVVVRSHRKSREMSRKAGF